MPDSSSYSTHGTIRTVASVFSQAILATQRIDTPNETDRLEVRVAISNEYLPIFEDKKYYKHIQKDLCKGLFWIQLCVHIIPLKYYKHAQH